MRLALEVCTYVSGSRRGGKPRHQADIYPVSAADIGPVSAADICPLQKSLARLTYTQADHAHVHKQTGPTYA